MKTVVLTPKGSTGKVIANPMHIIAVEQTSEAAAVHVTFTNGTVLSVEEPLTQVRSQLDVALEH